jgi:hypothetical protein
LRHSPNYEASEKKRRHKKRVQSRGNLEASEKRKNDIINVYRVRRKKEQNSKKEKAQQKKITKFQSVFFSRFKFLGVYFFAAFLVYGSFCGVFVAVFASNPPRKKKAAKKINT